VKFNKPPISVSDQVALLKQRGLKITNDSNAISYLSNINYYRLRAYTYPFQNNTDPNHPFNVSITLDEIIKLYVFDRKIRMLVFDVLEKIEIAMRTQIIYKYAINHGCHWQLKAALYRDSAKFASHITSLQNEIDRSTETFITHYQDKYSSPTEPPCWMSLEVSSFGLLSLIFSNLSRSAEKTAIANYFGLPDIKLLENWMHCFSHIRNICAHHGRLWNRRLTAHIKFPLKPRHRFIKDTNVYPYKLYAPLVCMQYILQIISPQSGFKDKLKELMKECPLKQEKEMGFPKGWQDENFWK
jgi:abortive infection bacteriophage resistance protein